MMGDLQESVEARDQGIGWVQAEIEDLLLGMRELEAAGKEMKMMDIPWVGVHCRPSKIEVF